MPGSAGLALQSGGVGVVLLEHLSRLGVGISSFVSLGDKDDVSGNDMLLWCESDTATKLAVLYLESFGNPRKFARTARRVGRAKPVLTVNVGQSAAGRRLAAARAAVAEAPLLTRQALLEQAGVIAAANLGELLDTVALLGIAAGASGAQSRSGVQYPRWRDARRRRVRRRAAAGRQPGRGYPAGAPAPAPRRCRGGRPSRYHGGDRARNLPSVP